MESRKQYLQSLQKEYLGSRKVEKNTLLNEAIKRTGLGRNYITRKLSPKTNWEKTPRALGTRAREYSSDLITHLLTIWDIFDNPCGQRLKPMIRDEIDRLRRFEEVVVSDEQSAKLKKMCPKTIDTLLSHEKGVRILNEKYTKKKHPLLYQQIPTKMSDEWDREIVGQIQIDGVEHCGQSASGQYVNSISHTDISSHWWEGEAVIGKGQKGTLHAMEMARDRFPFMWDEIHPDNGTSFINYFVYDYAKAENLKFSRSRPYQKNDNCFVEQKNSQNIRKVFGHLRFDTAREMDILNDLYHNDLRLYKNFFQPVMRLEIKKRTKGHIYRKYQEAKTPYRWLMDSPIVSAEIKKKLKAQYDMLNPAELKRNIDIKLKTLAKINREIEQGEKENITKKITALTTKETTTKVSFLDYPTTISKCPVGIT